MIRNLLVSILVSISAILSAQSPITLEDIWQDYTFYANSVPGFNFQLDGVHYTRLEKQKIMQYDLRTGQVTKELFSAEEIKGQAGFSGSIRGYEFSPDESKILLYSDAESVYRYSFRAKFYVWDGEKLKDVFPEGKVQEATFSPDGSKVAFVHKNNLYYTVLATGETWMVTEDGALNSIINGVTDWVYEEEFGFVKAFAWSPDGKRLAYYRFDESEVKEFTMTNYWGELYPEYVTFKYPKVGEKNSKVSVFLYELDGEKKTPIQLDFEPEYIPRIKWTLDPNELIVFAMNRHQSELNLVKIDATMGKGKVLLTEKNNYYIDIHDNLTFLKDREHFIWTSEQDGYNHIYQYNLDGKLVQQITKGDWEVTSFYGIDEAKGKVYYQSTEESPLERYIYMADLDGKNARKLTPEKGWNRVQFSSTFDYYVNIHSTINTPPTYTVMDRKGKAVRVIEDNKDLRQLQKEYGVQPVEFFEFTTSEDVELNGYMIKPPNFDPNKEYPVFMYLYGGPGSQQVMDSWRGQNYWWFQMLAQQGYIIACVDNRGTGGRGEEFKKMTYLQLGKYETIDQIEAAKYLGGLAYTDADRIGIFGWSYGGYMSTSCLLKGNDVFKAAIAVAPVTSWKWYDTIYTERYMRTEKENEEGYADNSPVYFADRLKGNYLLVHGMGDDNVHFQHTAEMANALFKANKQFDTYFYPNRTHGIYGGNTRLHLYTKMTNFLQDRLMNDDTPVGQSRP